MRLAFDVFSLTLTLAEHTLTSLTLSQAEHTLTSLTLTLAEHTLTSLTLTLTEHTLTSLTLTLLMYFAVNHLTNKHNAELKRKPPPSYKCFAIMINFRFT